MRRSSELEQLILHWYQRISSGDVLGSAEQMFSRQEGLLAIGSDASEWWEDFVSVMQAYGETASLGALEIRVGDLRGYEEGAVGWVADRVVLRVPNGAEVPLRHTFVLHKENSEWKIVPAHSSISVSNPDWH